MSPGLTLVGMTSAFIMFGEFFVVVLLFESKVLYTFVESCLFEVVGMAELRIKIPDELKELESASGVNWQLVIEKRLKEEFEELVRLKRIVAKSKLTKEDAKKLADEVNLALARKYERLLKGK